MRSACGDLSLGRLVVVDPGTGRYALTKKVEVMPLQDAIEEIN